MMRLHIICLVNIADAARPHNVEFHHVFSHVFSNNIKVRRTNTKMKHHIQHDVTDVIDTPFCSTVCTITKLFRFARKMHGQHVRMNMGYRITSTTTTTKNNPPSTTTKSMHTQQRCAPACRTIQSCLPAIDEQRMLLFGHNRH